MNRLATFLFALLPCVMGHRRGDKPEIESGSTETTKREYKICSHLPRDYLPIKYPRWIFQSISLSGPVGYWPDGAIQFFSTRFMSLFLPLFESDAMCVSCVKNKDDQ